MQSTMQKNAMFQTQEVAFHEYDEQEFCNNSKSYNRDSDSETSATDDPRPKPDKATTYW
jgi:hypothetical protein